MRLKRFLIIFLILITGWILPSWALADSVIIVKGSTILQKNLDPVMLLPDGQILYSADLIKGFMGVSFSENDLLIRNIDQGTSSRYDNAYLSALSDLIENSLNDILTQDGTLIYIGERVAASAMFIDFNPNLHNISYYDPVLKIFTQATLTSDGGGTCVPATEVCDGMDNDCDGSVDEGFDPGAVEDCFDGKDTNCNGIPDLAENVCIAVPVTTTPDPVEVIPIDPETGAAPAVVTFSDVTVGGTTHVTTTDGNSVQEIPVEYKETSAQLFDVQSTVETSGTIEICFDYSTMNYTNEGNLALLHFEEATGQWKDITASIYTDTKEICGSTQTLSPFAIVELKDDDQDGYTADVDCNDSNADTYPGAAEIFDGNDNNCNGVTDEGFWDTDGDGIENCADPDPVDIPDVALKTAIEQALGISNPTQADMCGLETLNAEGLGISDLTGLEYTVSATELNLNHNSISNLAPLSRLKNLVILYLVGNQITVINDLAALTNLERLWIGINPLSDISILSGLTKLWQLHLSDTGIDDITPLSGLTNLFYLYIGDNPDLSDISPLAGLSRLGVLYIQRDSVTDLSVFTSPALSGMLHLAMHGNLIGDISPLSGLTQLNFVWLNDNCITDFAPIEGKEGLDVRGRDDQQPDTDGDGICNSVDPDKDGDGYTPAMGDCDDMDALRHPGTDEVCNGIDDNCNALIDEGFDEDGDGVADCYDICPGFDDNVDSDSDGVPDGCDLCQGNDSTGDTDSDGLCDDTDDDIDNDGIYNEVDTQIYSYSEMFSDAGAGGGTEGSFLSRGDQILRVTDHPSSGVTVGADLSGGKMSAVIEACNGKSSIKLTAGDKILLTCGSVILEVVTGTVEVEFVADDGTTATAEIVQDNTITFIPEEKTFEAPPTNAAPVVIIVEGTEVPVEPGETGYAVEIDIKPGDDRNSVNLGANGVIPAAILTTPDFDATTVDPATVALAGSTVNIAGKSDKYQAVHEDVDGDGDLDLSVKILNQLDLVEGDTVAHLEGKTYDGVTVHGQDTVRIVP